jgi:AcrR family transcriptional regulator
VPRAYDSPTRRERAALTRRAVIDAAVAAFAELGWSGTSMQAIAERAGVSVETVYRAAPGGKAALLGEAVQAALAGGAARAETAVDDRPSIRRVIDAASALDAVTAYAEVVPGTWRRLAPLLAAVDGADGEPSLTTLRAQLEEQRLAGMRRFARQLDAAGALRHGLDVDLAADVLWTVCSRANHQALVGARGWSERDYVAWLRRALAAELLAPPGLGASEADQ